MSFPERILISRTDAIGDVVLTLPLATLLRRRFPHAVIGFLGKSYTRPVIECCSAVDVFVDADDFLKEDNRRLKAVWDAIIHVFPRKDIARKALLAGIPWRIGTSSRPYHWISCNKLVKLSRRHSDLHEAQLNAKLLAPFGIAGESSKETLGNLYSFDKIPLLPIEFQGLLQPGKLHVILHPKSQGSAREWGLDHFAALTKLLPADRFQVFISGTAAEGALLQPLLKEAGDAVTDITGRMNLATFIAFIHACDALVAASTGPLHIAAALGKTAVGLYPSIRPMHAGRWRPLGERAIAFALPEDCDHCRNAPESCTCIRGISAAEIAGFLSKKLA